LTANKYFFAYLYNNTMLLIHKVKWILKVGLDDADCIRMAQIRDNYQAVANTVMKRSVP